MNSNTTEKKISTGLGIIFLTMAVIIDVLQFFLMFLIFTGILAVLGIALSWFLAAVLIPLFMMTMMSHHVPLFSGSKMKRTGATIIAEFIPIFGNFCPSLSIWIYLTLRENKKTMVKIATEARAQEEKELKRNATIRRRLAQQAEASAIEVPQGTRDNSPAVRRRYKDVNYRPDPTHEDLTFKQAA